MLLKVGSDTTERIFFSSRLLEPLKSTGGIVKRDAGWQQARVLHASPDLLCLNANRCFLEHHSDPKCLLLFPAPDQPVHNLLQLLSTSGAPRQEDLPAGILLLLHSRQDETGQISKCPCRGCL